MSYYEGVGLNEQDFFDGNYQVYPITQDNYRVILKEKSVEGYDQFFEENYK